MAGGSGPNLPRFGPLDKPEAFRRSAYGGKRNCRAASCRRLQDFFLTKPRSPANLAQTRDKQAPYAVDVIGRSPGSVINRRMLADNFSEWFATAASINVGQRLENYAPMFSFL